ncbi:hypothetical protein CHGG_05874 [Chaetomium globosum CBS 148.51]|uniref:Uncharacterized protein n=1 Tax=Chaetomium globosum (strain ATCC 6205 / CBS 148.51 / DSM 1962 / NBRC 6347 / NRRL 1970) TaxID=306901 RepID=Q2H641_CHAGB|nr:uncharacterized protein CHGG_05874 [Chaetomium globosum CBS 148.51]EAQ89255.1 hypothetical protein CHGG_05874 [Chaetomium globosum CBS 148.51]
MRLSAPTLAALCWLSAGRALCDEANSEIHSGLVGVDATNPQYLVYEVHEVEVVLAENDRPSRPSDTQRQIEEKEKLLQRLSKNYGTWNEHHARHRLLEALRGFSAYADTQQAELNRVERILLERTVKYSQKFADVAELLKKNQQLCDNIVRNAMDFYGVSQQELDKHVRVMKKAGRPAERVSVSQALKHFVRDWAASGAHERDAAFPCILQALKDQFPDAGQQELALNELVAVAETVGFELILVPVPMPVSVPVEGEGGGGGWEKCKAGGGLVPGKWVYGVEAVYGFDERALTRNAYEAVFWVARRV